MWQPTGNQQLCGNQLATSNYVATHWQPAIMWQPTGNQQLCGNSLATSNYVATHWQPAIMWQPPATINSVATSNCHWQLTGN